MLSPSRCSVPVLIPALLLVALSILPAGYAGRALWHRHALLQAVEAVYQPDYAVADPGIDTGRALARQAQMHEQSRQFFERYDYFVLPVTQVAPFDVTTPYPTQIAGASMATYIDWMRSCWYVSFMSNPAISVPGGFTPGGLPVGVQIVGRHRDDWSVLQLAHAFEQATQYGKTRPPVAL